MKLLNEFSQIFCKILLLEFCLLLLIFPLESFRINIITDIFPSFAMILLYYFATYYQISFGMLFLTGIVFDQIYSMPIGTNSLVLIIAHSLLKIAGKYVVITDYITNFMIFIIYYFFILHFIYLLTLTKNLSSQGYLAIIMQYLTTIFSYNLLRIPLDSLLEYLKKYAK